MSPAEPRRSTHAATHTAAQSRQGGAPVSDCRGGGNTSVLDMALMEGAVAKRPHEPRSAVPLRLNLTGAAEPLRCADPSNYLG